MADPKRFLLPTLSILLLGLVAQGCAVGHRCKAPEFARIEGTVAQAERSLQARKFERADQLAALAIKEIGTRYFDPHALDDTGQRLALADGMRSRGDVATSASVRVRMARSRVEAFRSNAGC